MHRITCTLKNQQRYEQVKGKVAIVTGGATGIGEAISKKFAKEGAKVVVAGMQQDPVEDVVQDIKIQEAKRSFKGDLVQEQDEKQCIRNCVDAWENSIYSSIMQAFSQR